MKIWIETTEISLKWLIQPIRLWLIEVIGMQDERIDCLKVRYIFRGGGGKAWENLDRNNLKGP